VDPEDDLMRVDHESVVKPEVIWARDPHGGAYLDPFTEWWLRSYYREADRRRVPGHLHMRFFQHLLGPQTTTVTFVHRNRVWHEPEEGWTLYVDRRGPAFHVRLGMTSQDAWDAFKRFRDRVDARIKVA
jgi:hypothetical protein